MKQDDKTHPLQVNRPVEVQAGGSGSTGGDAGTGSGVGGTASAAGASGGGGGARRVLDDLLVPRLPDFLLYEYWQLRQEIRDRLLSIRTVTGVAVTAFTAVVAASATLLNTQSPNYFSVGAIWLVPHAILIASIMMIYSEQLSIINLARYVRLHLELPFLESSSRRLQESSIWHAVRMPVGWESYLLVGRRLSKKLRDRKIWRQLKQLANDKDSWDKEGSAHLLELRRILGQVDLPIQPDAILERKNLQSALLCGQRDDLAAASVMWVFRGMSLISTLACLVFLCFAYRFQFESLTRIITTPWVVIASILALSLLAIAATAVLWLLCRRFRRSQGVDAYWDIPSLDVQHTDELIESFRDRP